MKGMNGKMYKISCEPDCGFAAQSHDEKELVGIVKEHAKRMHKMSVSDADIRMKMSAS